MAATDEGPRPIPVDETDAVATLPARKVISLLFIEHGESTPDTFICDTREGLLLSGTPAAMQATSSARRAVSWRRRADE